jgi:imidazolonepropionase-like amidohydrolase
VAAGPLLSTIDFWLNVPGERQFLHLKDAAAAPELVRYLASRGSKAVKLWYIVTPQQSVEASAPAVLAAGEEVRRAGLPLIVHATGLEEAKVALRAGARLLVHSVWDKPVDEEFVELARGSGAVYCPTLTVMRGYLRLFEAAAAKQAPKADDPNGCLDAATRARLEATVRAEAPDPKRMASLAERVAEQERVAAANLKRLSDAGVTIAMGTDAGNPLTLHGPAVYAELEAMAAAGLTPMQVLVAATRGGSLALGLEKDIGTVEKGKSADLVVLDADPAADAGAWRRVSAIVRGGVLRPVAELKSDE